MIRKKIYLLGESIRNPSLKKSYDFLCKSDFWTSKNLENYQKEKFLELINFCFDYNDFYRKLFLKQGLTKDSFNSLEDLEKIPVLTKKDLISNHQEIHSNYSFKKKFKATTSGSSGETLQYFRNEEADSFSRALSYRGYSWYNVHPADFNGYFWGFDFTLLQKMKTAILDYFQNRVRIFSYKENDLRKFLIKANKAVYIHGYSSMIYETAKLFKKFNLKAPSNLKFIKGTSEKILPIYQEEVIAAFGLPIISEYGATESGIIAFECPKRNLHISMEGVIVEEVDNEIIVTNLHLKSFPIIRYKLGDYIELEDKSVKCSCGREHYMIKEITGRVGESIKGKRNIFPTLTLYYIFKNLSKKNNLNLDYQAIQKRKGVLEINIKQSISDIQNSLILKEAEMYFENDIEIKINSSYESFKKNGKIKHFISEL